MSSTSKTLRPQAFKKVVPFLEQSDTFTRIVAGELRVPDTETYISSAFFPALTPVWATGAGTIAGLWKHWFSETRDVTFVHYFGRTVFGVRNMVFEYGRTFEQLLYLHLLECMTNDEGISESTAAFMKEAGVKDGDEIDRASMACGTPDGLLEHQAFGANSPLICFSDTSLYSGDFPNGGMNLSHELLRNSCVVEYHSGFKAMAPDLTLRNEIAGLRDAPDWFRASDQRDVFNERMSNNDLLGAWMTLNSPGWKLGDAKIAIQELAAVADNEPFKVVADTWCEIPFGDEELL